MYTGMDVVRRYCVSQFVNRLAVMTLLVSCFLVSFPALAQTLRQEEDKIQIEELWGLVQNRQILLRAVFDKIPTAPKGFATAVEKRRREIQNAAGLADAETGKKSFGRDEEWSRELVNLEQPQLRFESKTPKQFTALESTTALLNGGRTITYLEESEELSANYSIGLLYNADAVDAKNWKYVYKADAHSFHFLNSDGKPAKVDPDPDGKPGIDQAAKRNRVSGPTDRAGIMAVLERVSGISSGQFAPMNEVIVGLSKDALVGVYFSVTVQGERQDGLDYITFQAISRRQLVRKYLKKDVPLIQVPYPSSDQIQDSTEAAAKEVIAWSLSEQRKFLVYLASRADLTDEQRTNVAELTTKLDDEINGN